MSQKRSALNSYEVQPVKGDGGGKKNKKNANASDSKFKENVIRKLYESFQDSFDLALIASVAHTCQWDIVKATEALSLLSGVKGNKKNKGSKGEHAGGVKNKAKSLPGTLKVEKSADGRGMNPSNPTHYSTSSLSSGQVWQRHYKSKPQSPGLLTMIPPHNKEIVKLKKSGSGASTPKEKMIDVKKASGVINRIQQLVQNRVKVMILMRGVPGSGKTHLAQVVVSLVTGNELNQHIFSTDDYFIMLGRGNYAYDFNQLPQAHNWNQKRVSEALKREINPVVVDNTNTQSWEMQPYVMMAVEHGYLIEVLEPVTEWRNKEAELARRNVHSVPREKIRQMLERYEPGWTGEKLLKSFGLKYKHCGASHVPQEKRAPTNSVLAQHRQHSVIDAPEKPKRKKNGAKKKDRHQVAGVEITEDKEKQLEELNKLFAEYGKTMDPVSRQKVLESGVPISEVVSRMRKLQGNILPLPKSSVPPTIPETENPPFKNVIKPVPKYSAPRRESFSESVEPDTMSSSNASETSECETDTEAEPPKWKEMRKYFEYGDSGHFVDGEDLWEDYDEEETSRGKAEEAAGGKPSKSQITSSQEELSLIDFGSSATPASFSQDDLSLLNYDGTESVNEDSSSSSEEQETQMLTLQESLREALMDKDGGEGEAKESGPVSRPPEVELTDSLLAVMSKRFGNGEPERKMEVETKDTALSINESLLEMLVKKYSQEEPSQEASVADCKKSPDLEEVPLPSIPAEDKPKSGEPHDWSGTKRDKFEDIVSSWEHPPATGQKEDGSPKEARQRNSLKGAIRKTGIQRDKSPEGLLKSAELSWASIPFTSSWEDVSKKPAEKDGANIPPKSQRKFVQKMESSTNTLHEDFDLWKREGDGIARVVPRRRNINENYMAPPTRPVSDVLMLDKGSMTLDAEEVYSLEKDKAVDDLSGMFPGIPRESLKDIVEKCKGNIMWAVEVLLDSPQNLGPPERTPAEEDPPSYNEAKAMTDSETAPIKNLLISDGKKTIKRRKDKKAPTSELSLLLKKQIEDSVHINEELYQDKTLFIKKLRHGEIEFGDGPIEPVPEPPKEVESDRGDKNEVLEGEDEGEDEEETIPMKVDPEFFRALNKHFGSSDASDCEKQTNFMPMINVPISLAHQIYDCWLENVNRQLEDMQTAYDQMIKEDELLAAALQEQEFEYRQPDLREIMDMELAMLLYKQDQAHMPENPETLASKLSRQLLLEAYPNMNKKMLLDLYESEGRSFGKTVEILSAWENEMPTTVVAPEFLSSHGNKLLEQAKSESLKKNESVDKKPILIVKANTSKTAPEEKSVLLVNPVEYRQKTALLHQQRNECARMAQEAFRKKSFSVASYFSHIASLYKERIRELNKEPFPATLFEDKGTKVDTKVDLHFLFVPEALQILDLFLDYHIKELRKKGLGESTSVSLITGRGHHSAQGKSKIKPAVKKRLDERQLSFWESNPGMVNVTLYRHDLLSEEM